MSKVGSGSSQGGIIFRRSSSQAIMHAWGQLHSTVPGLPSPAAKSAGLLDSLQDCCSVP